MPKKDSQQTDIQEPTAGQGLAHPMASPTDRLDHCRHNLEQHDVLPLKPHTIVVLM